MGLGTAMQNSLMCDRMRMDPTDFADVTGYMTYLMNGLPPRQLDRAVSSGQAGPTAIY